MEASKNQISDIFNRYRRLEIPFFQRAYVWGEDQWQRFLDDLVYISTEEKPYFFGSLIFKQRDVPIGEKIGDVRTVIDGQQRLTTLIIFFKVLALLKDESKIFETFQLDDQSVALSHNHNDIDSFNKISELDNLKVLSGDVSSDNIIKAYQFFKSHINSEKIDESRIRRNIVFVVVNLLNNDDEQQIFDTLNSLGVRLTTAELLKNYFFRKDNFALYKSHWRAVFEADDDTKEYWDRELYTGRGQRTFIDLFFYAYLQVKVQSMGSTITPRDREAFSRLENLFSSYKNLIHDYGLKKKDVLEEIKEHAILFRSNFDNGVVNSGLEGSPSMQRINAIIFGLETTTLIPYILFIINNTNDDAQRKELFRAIESYIMRRLVMRVSNRSYNLLFLGMISKRILTKEIFFESIGRLSDAGTAIPTDAELQKGFGDSKLVNKTAKGILYFIESRLRSDKDSLELKGMSQYSLEHLMPKKWRNNWGALEEQQAGERDKKLLTLGNLAIITRPLNLAIRDSAWSVKKEGQPSKGGLNHYASGIEIHRSFLGEEVWDESKMENRAEKLFNHAKCIWPTE